MGVTLNVPVSWAPHFRPAGGPVWQTVLAISMGPASGPANVQPVGTGGVCEVFSCSVVGVADLDPSPEPHASGSAAASAKITNRAGFLSIATPPAEGGRIVSPGRQHGNLERFDLSVIVGILGGSATLKAGAIKPRVSLKRISRFCLGSLALVLLAVSRSAGPTATPPATAAARHCLVSRCSRASPRRTT